MAIAKQGARAGLEWLGCGWRLARSNARLWLGMAAVYLVIALVLDQIPFLGDLILVFLTPPLLAGALLVADEQSRPPAGPAPDAAPPGGRLTAGERILRPTRALFRIFSDEQRVLPVLFMGALTLTLYILIRIVGDLLGGGSPLSGGAAVASPVLTVIHLLFWLLMVALYAGLVVSLFYAMPLVTLRDENPFTAITTSIRTCAHNAGPLLVPAAVFILAWVVVMVLFYLSAVLGYVAVVAVGLPVLPLIVTGSYCSYRELFD